MKFRSTILLAATVALLVPGCSQGIATIGNEDAVASGGIGSTVSGGNHLTLSVAQTAYPPGGVDGEVSVPFTIRVTNEANVRVGIKRITMSSVGETAYRILRTSRTVDEAVGGSESVELSYYARALTVRSSTRQPLLLRLVVDYEIEGDEYSEAFTVRAGDRFTTEIDLD